MPETPKPEYTGDIYKVVGYPASGMTVYGWAYKGGDPSIPGQWCWRLEMADGDMFPWPEGWEAPDMPLDSIELVRRNPLPAEVKRR